MILLGLPFIKGYKPLKNFQNLIIEIVANYLSINRYNYINLFEEFSSATSSLTIPFQSDFINVQSEPPEREMKVKEKVYNYKPILINYLEREQNNSILGAEGEKFILEFEKWRLLKSGNKNLSEQVEWKSKSEGDGLGFDILSKNENGSDRFIEVKTTKLSKETPIYLTRNELEFSKLKSNDFYLYRVYNWGERPKFYCKNGNYQNYTSLEALSFKGNVF